MDQARALRELQAALQLRLDAIYAPFAPRVAAILNRLASDGRLTITAATLAVIEIHALLDRADHRAADTIAQGIAAAAILPTQDAPDINRAWKAAAGFAAAAYLLRVRRALRDGRARSMAQVRQVVTQAARTERAIMDVTLHLEQYVNPYYATRRDARGIQRRITRTGARVSGPAVPGQAASSARGLMVTETSAAHGHAAIVQAQRTPDALIRWQLAPWHKDADECDEKASADSGFGSGVYRPSDVPEYPSHGHCACVLTVV